EVEEPVVAVSEGREDARPSTAAPGNVRPSTASGRGARPDVAVPVAGGSSSSTAANSANPPPPAAVRATASDGASASPPPEGRPARKKEEGGLFARGFLNKPPKKRPAAKAEAASSRQRSRSPGRGASTDASSSQQLGSRKDGDAGDVGATALRAAHETIAKEQATGVRFFHECQFRE
ncbi:unnamed protein product, partial [Polarella glacialis]